MLQATFVTVLASLYCLFLKKPWLHFSAVTCWPVRKVTTAGLGINGVKSVDSFAIKGRSINKFL